MMRSIALKSKQTRIIKNSKEIRARLHTLAKSKETLAKIQELQHLRDLQVYPYF